MSFAELGLRAALVRNLARLGCPDPWPIQAAAIPPILAGKDFIGLAATGKGKTIAFVAPVAQQMLADPEHSPSRRRERRALPPRALIVCPTRELAQQVASDAIGVCRGTRLIIGCVYGKVGMRDQIEALRAGVDILIGTPGRLRDLLGAEALDLSAIRHVVIDEADRLHDLSFLPQIRHLLESAPSERQTLLFSATMPAPVEELVRRHLREPARAEVDPQSQPVAHVEQHLVRAVDRDKVAIVLELLRGLRDEAALIFCGTRRRVGWVAAALGRHGAKVDMLHGDRSAAQRRRAGERLAGGEVSALVTTDVAARGLHLPRVTLVINYDVPMDPQEYVHRIGRSAHGGGHGAAYSLVTWFDARRWSAVTGLPGVKVTEHDQAEFLAPPASPVVRGSAPVKKKEPARRSAKRDASGAERGRGGSRRDRQREGGGSPSASPTHHSKSKKKRREDPVAEDGTTPRRRTRRPGASRSRARAAIAKGEKPGRGVVRPE